MESNSHKWPFCRAGMGAHWPAFVVSKKHKGNRAPHSFLTPLPMEKASVQMIKMLLEVTGFPNDKNRTNWKLDWFSVGFLFLACFLDF